MVYSAAAVASLSGMGGNFTLNGQWQNNIGIIFSLSTSLGNWWLQVTHKKVSQIRWIYNLQERTLEVLNSSWQQCEVGGKIEQDVNSLKRFNIHWVDWQNGDTHEIILGFDMYFDQLLQVNIVWLLKYSDWIFHLKNVKSTRINPRLIFRVTEYTCSTCLFPGSTFFHLCFSGPNTWNG